MGLSTLIARILSVLYLSAAAAGMVDPGFYRRLVEDLYANAALTYVAGLLALVLGSLIVQHHNVWRRDWTVLITLIGWLALVKGVLLIVFPQFMRHLSEPLLAGPGPKLLPLLTLLLGLLFAYLGSARGRA